MPGSSLPTVVFAIDALGRAADRVGRTHVQKLLYLAEGWGLLPSTHAFSLYLHGPYSRDLDGEILALRAAGVVTANPDPAGYGARYSVSNRHASEAREILSQFPLKEAETLASMLAPRGVRELEAISTCEFARRQLGDDEGLNVESKVKSLKPHLSEDEIAAAHESLRKALAAVEQ